MTVFTDSPVVLGIDVGTTSVKVYAADREGRIQANTTLRYPLMSPRTGWAEQDCEVIWTAVVDGVRTVCQHVALSDRRIAAVSLGSAYHSLIALGADGTPISPNITWADNRAAAYAMRLRAGDGADALVQRTGLPLLPMSPLTKLCWMRQEQPEVFRAAATFVSIKDLVLERMTGERCTDLSMASAMGLFDIRKHVWDGEALEIAGISAKRLPAVAEPTTVFSRLSKGAAESTGLPRDTPVIIGAGDGFLANLGSGAVGRGQANLTIGTSLGLRTITAQPYTDPNGGTFCYAATSDRWLVGCAGSSGGIALDWLARLLNASDDKAWHDAIVAKALGLSPGSNGLICLPYVVGERAPQRNAESRGVFFGFGLHHSQEHFWRAALEGIFLVARGMLGSIVRLTGPIDDIRASGGVLRERAVASILAACLGQPVSTLASYNASALGSVLLALVALGEYAQIEDTGHLVDTVTTACTSKDAEAYARLAEKSDALYSSTVALVAG